MTKTNKKYQTKHLKNQAKTFFRKHKSVCCLAFPKEKIHFNSKGLHHLFYESAMRVRPLKEIEARVILLPRALKLLKKITLWQEERTYSHENTIIHYWALEAVIDERRIKVIIRQKERGKKCFWSVIPAWRRSDGKIINAKSKLNEQ